MSKIIGRSFLFLLSVLALTLFSPALLEAGCSTTCSGGKCSTNISGATCCCDSSGDAHCFVASEVEDNPCAESALQFDATPEELAAFKDQIDKWYAAGLPELTALGDAASALYTSVLVQDADGYLRASSSYRQLLASSAQETPDQEAPGKKPRR